MRDLVKRSTRENGDQPTNKKMKEEPVDIKPDLRKVKQEMDEIEVIGEVRRIPSLLDNNIVLHNYSHNLNERRFVPPTVIDRLMIIPRERVGLVIGKKGATLHDLRARFPSVSMMLDTMSGKETGLPCPLYVRGTREQTAAVIEMVSEKIGYFSPIYQSAPIHNYFKEITVSRDGIYSIDKSRLEKENQVVMIFSEEGDGPTRSIIITGNQLNVNGATSRIEGMMRECPDGVITWRMRVPHYSVGRVIGARHANIIETRRKSGARVELLNAKDGEDSFFRYFEMIGTREQIATADKMMREFSGQYLDGSFLQTSLDSGYSTNTHSPKSLNNSLSLPLPSSLSSPPPPSRLRATRFYG